MPADDQPNNQFPPRADGTTAPRPRLASVSDACAYGCMGHTKLYEYINQGKIIAFKRESRTLIDLDSIDAMNASLQRVPPKAA